MVQCCSRHLSLNLLLQTFNVMIAKRLTHPITGNLKSRFVSRLIISEHSCSWNNSFSSIMLLISAWVSKTLMEVQLDLISNLNIDRMRYDWQSLSETMFFVEKSMPSSSFPMMSSKELTITNIPSTLSWLQFAEMTLLSFQKLSQTFWVVLDQWFWYTRFLNLFISWISKQCKHSKLIKSIIGNMHSNKPLEEIDYLSL